MMTAIFLIFLDGGGDELGVVDEAVPVDILVPQHGVHQERELRVLEQLWLCVIMTFMRFSLCVCLCKEQFCAISIPKPGLTGQLPGYICSCNDSFQCT